MHRPVRTDSAEFFVIAIEKIIERGGGAPFFSLKNQGNVGGSEQNGCRNFQFSNAQRLTDPVALDSIADMIMVLNKTDEMMA